MIIFSNFFIFLSTVQIFHNEQLVARKRRGRTTYPQGRHETLGGAGIFQTYLTVFINWYQAFDGHVPDVASSEEDFACRK